MSRYILAFDQSTQGTKCLITDETGTIVANVSLPHRQIITEEGYVSHDPKEIYANVLKCAERAIADSLIESKDIVGIGISNQRETSVVWRKNDGKPLCDAIVWQCSRSKEIVKRISSPVVDEMIKNRTGLQLSPFFPASKFAWILKNIPDAAELSRQHELCYGTVDTYLLYRMTNGASYLTDYSNASRTQLLNIRELYWDEEICSLFGIDPEDLAEVTDSDACFGETDLEGILDRTVPIYAVLGDSHAALFAQGCLKEKMAKATYGTGSSVMMNVGPSFVSSKNGLVSSLAFKYRGTVNYVLEGNINYAGAVISWLKDDVQLIDSAGETEEACFRANPEDECCFVPAFTGLGAPYWKDDAKAIFTGITRTTGKNEIIKAAVDSIACQIRDIVHAMEEDTGSKLGELRVDGGPTSNRYLMQLQSDLLDSDVHVSDTKELSALGVAYMAGISLGLYSEDILQAINRNVYRPKMSEEERTKKLLLWHQAIDMV